MPSPSLSEIQIQRLIGDFEHPSREARHQAVDVLAAQGERALPFLLEATRSSEKFARAGALRTLTLLNTPRAREAMIHYVRQNPYEPGDNRTFAIQAIAENLSDQTPNKSSILRFLQECTADPSLFVRGFAYLGMGNLGDPRVLPLLEKGLRDKESFVTEKATQAMQNLRQSKPPQHHEEDNLFAGQDLSIHLQSRESARRDMAIQEVLRRAQQGQDVYAVLQSTLHGPNILGQQSALEAFGALQDKRVLLDLMRILQSSDAHDDVRASALRCLGSFRSDQLHEELSKRQKDEFVRLLRGYLNRPGLLLRTTALAALRALPDENAVEHLVRAAHDQNAWMRNEAAQNLLELPTDFLLPHTESLAKLTLHSLRSMPSQVTETGGDGSGSLQDLKSFQTRLLLVLADVLPETEDAETQKLMFDVGLQGLSARSAEVRVRSLNLLAALSKWTRMDVLPHEFQEISQALSSAEEGNINMTLDILHNWLPEGSSIITPELVDVLGRGKASMALRVITLLGRAGDREALEVLRELSHNANTRIAEAAQTSLREAFHR